MHVRKQEQDRLQFNFSYARCEVKHIAHFLDLAQDCLVRIHPLPDDQKDKLDSVFSLVLISERIAQGVMDQLNAGELETFRCRNDQEGALCPLL